VDDDFDEGRMLVAGGWWLNIDLQVFGEVSFLEA
jgi:hypothetical protein